MKLTDSQKVIQLFDELGITYETGGTTLCITCEGPKNEGYTDFECVFTFDDEGTFKIVGVWE